MNVFTFIVVNVSVLCLVDVVQGKKSRKTYSYNGLQRRNHTTDFQQDNSTNHNLDSNHLRQEPTHQYHQVVQVNGSNNSIHQTLQPRISYPSNQIDDPSQSPNKSNEDEDSNETHDTNSSSESDEDTHDMDPQPVLNNSTTLKKHILIISGGLHDNLMGATVKYFTGGIIKELKEGDTIINFLGGVIKHISGGIIFNVYGGTIGLPASLEDVIDSLYDDGPRKPKPQYSAPTTRPAQNPFHGDPMQTVCKAGGCRS